jgi:hypothetical protein
MLIDDTVAAAAAAGARRQQPIADVVSQLGIVPLSAFLRPVTAQSVVYFKRSTGRSPKIKKPGDTPTTS